MADLNRTPLRRDMLRAAKAGSVRMGDDSRWHCVGLAPSTPSQRGRTLTALWLGGYIWVINEGRVELTPAGERLLERWGGGS